ncbi:MAG: hypothetical protein KJ070_22940 [Verrucomicrobia bacterium]|nr:hypothetical protein [Verrucomicrobiota bacterium]
MTFANMLLVAAIVLVLVFGVYWTVTHFFSEEARMERRRRRSNAPISSKRKGPMVKFSVRTPKKD